MNVWYTNSVALMNRKRSGAIHVGLKQKIAHSRKTKRKEVSQTQR